jgi:hypothetical protein
MTIETRGTIEPKDVRSFEIECPKCHSKTVHPLQLEIEFPIVCIHCRDQWIIPGSQEHTDMMRFLNLLRRYSTAKQAFILRFEVAGLGDRQ